MSVFSIQPHEDSFVIHIYRPLPVNHEHNVSATQPGRNLHAPSPSNLGSPVQPFFFPSVASTEKICEAKEQAKVAPTACRMKPKRLGFLSRFGRGSKVKGCLMEPLQLLKKPNDSS